MPRSPDLTPIYGIARGLCIGACMWAPVILLLFWGSLIGAAKLELSAARDQEAFVSYRTANGGQP